LLEYTVTEMDGEKRFSGRAVVHKDEGNGIDYCTYRESEGFQVLTG